MVRRDQTFAVQIEQFGKNTRYAFINRLHRLDTGRNHSGVSNHIGIGEIEDNQIVVGHARQHLLCEEPRTHLRLKIVGRHFRGRNDFTILVLERLFDSAVKEICDVRIFFRLGDTELRLPGRAHDLSKNV